jgi:predicted nucleic acid-binding protein
MFLLDTNIVSELPKAKSGKADRNVVAWAACASAGSMFVSVVTIEELEVGVLLSEPLLCPGSAPTPGNCCR